LLRVHYAETLVMPTGSVMSLVVGGFAVSGSA
jgi:hypothetical protein